MIRPFGSGQLQSARDVGGQGATRLLRCAPALRVTAAAPSTGLRLSNEKRSFSFGPNESLKTERSDSHPRANGVPGRAG